MSTPEPRVIQYFGNAEVANGGFLFQGVVTGDIHIHIHLRPHEVLTISQDISNVAANAVNKQHIHVCLRDSRTGVLNQIRKWTEERVCWLKGMAVAREYYGNSLLAASSFFSRDGVDLASAKRFAATIASQVGEISDEIQRFISEAFKSNPRVDSLPMYDKWQKLVLQPLSKAWNVNGSQLPL